MELVYLWVEGYKKFNKQGFNFSPKFICEFKDEYEKDANGNERLKLKCQLFIKPKKHLENFFGDNINITGVVGENGAGKSSLLELLLMINGNRWHHLKSFLFIYRIGNTLYTVPHQITPFLIYDKKSTKVIIDNISNSRDYGSIWINYKHLTNTKEAMMLISIINKQSLYNIHNNEYFISKHIHVYNNYAIVLSHIKDKYFFNTFQVKLKPKKMQNIDKNFKFYELFNKIIMKFYPSQKNMLQIVSDTKPLLTAENQLAYNCFISYVQFYVEYHEQINNDKMKAETFFKNSLENILEYLSIDNTYEIIITELNKFKKLLPKYERNFYLAFENILNNILYLKECLSDFILQDDCYIQNIALINDKKINSLISKTKYLSDSLTVDEYIFNFVDYDFINDDTGINYNNLSDGEKEILNICIDTIHHIDQYKDKNVLLLSNEIDNSLHPNWKKEILSILIKIFHEFIKIYTKTNIHFITTTHSPFILSDLPKENIIFLQDSRQVYPFKESEQTFGANIHTLLSHGFFMENGLMGEFAKSKINEILNFHNIIKKKRHLRCLKKIYIHSKQTLFWQTQKIIGEEYFKQVIKNHLIEIEKILLGKDAAKNAEITRVKAYLESLEND